MKKVIVVIVMVVAGFTTSCKKYETVRPQAPLATYMGFKKDISTAD